MKRDVEPDELLLTAFRYVAGELSAQDASQFEARLANDLDAQQALADAVLLGDAVARATVVVRRRPDLHAASQRGLRVGAILAVVAATLLVAITLWPAS